MRETSALFMLEVAYMDLEVDPHKVDHFILI